MGSAVVSRSAVRRGARPAQHLLVCLACGQQHSLLKGTIFEQTKTGLAKWFLAIYLVTSSRLPHGRWALAAIRRGAAVATRSARRWSGPIRQPLSDRVEGPDATHPGAAKPGRPGLRRCRQGAGRRCRRSRRRQGPRAPASPLRLARLPDAGATSLEGFVAANVAKPAAVATDGWAGYAGPAGERIPPRADQSQHGPGGDAVLRLPAIHLVFGLGRLASWHPSRAVGDLR